MKRKNAVHTTCEVMNMEEPMQEGMNRFRTFFKNNGFYVVLVLCLVLIGGAIALLAIPGATEEEAKATPASEPIVIVGQSNDERLNEVLTKPKETATPIPTLPIKLTPIPIATAEPTPSSMMEQIGRASCRERV